MAYGTALNLISMKSVIERYNKAKAEHGQLLNPASEVKVQFYEQWLQTLS